MCTSQKNWIKLNVWKWTAGWGNFPHKAWESVTTYSRRGGRGSRGLNLKIQPCVENFFLAYLLTQKIIYWPSRWPKISEIVNLRSKRYSTPGHPPQRRELVSAIVSWSIGGNPVSPRINVCLRDRDLSEMAWTNGQILFRRLSCRVHTVICSLSWGLKSSTWCQVPSHGLMNASLLKLDRF
jgi:hypothetical protein